MMRLKFLLDIDLSVVAVLSDRITNQNILSNTLLVLSRIPQDLADELHVYIGACMLGSSSKRWAQVS